MNAYPQPALLRSVGSADEGKAFTVQTSAAAVDMLELGTLAKQSMLGQALADQGYAESLFRPFALRADKTALPPRVLILSRKPWTCLRLILLG
jgi:hypothetical protein